MQYTAFHWCSFTCILNYNTFSLHANDRPSYNVGTKCNRCTDTNSAKKYMYTLFLKDQYLSTCKVEHVHVYAFPILKMRKINMNIMFAESPPPT